MKKRIISLLAVILAFTVLAGCSASNDFKTEASDADGGANKGYDNYYENRDDVMVSEPEKDYAEDSENTSSGFSGESVAKSVSLYEKIIYSSNVELETIKFEESIEGLYDIIDEYDAFVENSYITGKNYNAEYYGYQTYRYAEFVIRVPVDKFAGITSALDSLGSVTSTNNSVSNITERFYDTEARLKTYETQEERLLEMLEKTEDIYSMIEIETKLSEVRYQIESLESTLRNWQNEVDYSTVTVCINEVKEITPIVSAQRSYWEEITDGFKASLKSVGNFFTEFFKGFVICLPVVLTIAVVAVILILVIRSIVFKKHPEYKEALKKRRLYKKNKKALTQETNTEE